MHSEELKEKDIIGESAIVKNKIYFIHKAASCDKNILILGETGTGKELTARKIHELSNRRRQPFVAVNCANMPEELFEAELFGFARGAFTGAIREKPGLVEAAKDGTVFMDEIGELSTYLQAKILRLIDEKEFRRVGETVIRKVLARFIFATNLDLKEEVKAGRFREDLYYRISVLRHYIPPLRERKEDIPLLVEHILEEENKKKNTQKQISLPALEKLTTYRFPGNIRELRNIIERAHLFSEGDEITEMHIKLDDDLGRNQADLEITPNRLWQALERCYWNKTKAANEIGKSRRHFYRLLERHRMTDCIKRGTSFKSSGS